MKTVVLDKNTHNREAFDCGTQRLNLFLRDQACSAASRNLSRTRVLIDDQNPSEIIGFHTVTYNEVSPPVDSKLYKKYPHKIPALLLSRLAVDVKHQGKGHGEHLLLEVICMTARAEIEGLAPAPVIGLVVDAKNGKNGFYEKYGFQIMDPDAPDRLWLPIGTCIEILNHINK